MAKLGQRDQLCYSERAGRAWPAWIQPRPTGGRWWVGGLEVGTLRVCLEDEMGGLGCEIAWDQGGPSRN